MLRLITPPMVIKLSGPIVWPHTGKEKGATKIYPKRGTQQAAICEIAIKLYNIFHIVNHEPNVVLIK